ncbi:MAG TPA: aspartate dehydrogenase [Pseudolabrys sp.]|jgi:aspartate dehydrogenase
MSKHLRVVFIGWGAINSRVAALLAQRKAGIEIAGIAVRNVHGDRADFPRGARLLTSPAELAEVKSDLIVEAAGRAAVEQWGPMALGAAPEMIVASTSAFCDGQLMERLLAIAEQRGSRILLPSGAIGGIDALASAAVLGLDEVVHQVVKPPIAWKGTPAEKLVDLAALTQRTVFFSGTAREAAGQYPQNANATVVTSLAGIGLDKTRVELVADPAVRMNGHRIVARGAFGHMEIALENSPLATNPKSSELTALSLVRLIEHRVNRFIV